MVVKAKVDVDEMKTLDEKAEEIVERRTQVKDVRGEDVLAKCRQFEVADLARSVGLYPYFVTLQEYRGPMAVIDGSEKLMMGSSSYLGLSVHTEVKRAAAEAMERFGTSASGSRFLSGTFGLHGELELELAEFLGKEEALVFSSGYQANVGVISSLAGSGEAVLLDRYAHTSIHDGAMLSGAEVIRFDHNDPDDLSAKLEPLDGTPKLIVVDGVYSMGGDLAVLPDIVAIARSHGSNVMVDDVHAIGVVGPQGRGTAAHFGLTDDVDVIMGTFAKSLASSGGFVAASREVIEYIKHSANTVIFSASLPPASIAAAKAALGLLRDGDALREKLWRNTAALRTGLTELGFDTGSSETPIIPVVVGEDISTAMLWKALFDAGVYTDCVLFPAVPTGRSMLRTGCMASHTPEHVARAVAVFEQQGRKLGII